MSKKIGLALGGGGARGWAHIGVLRALEEHNIPIDCIAGTSIGALVGAVYVRGELYKLEEFASEVSMESLVSMMDISFPGLGLVNGERVRDFLTGYLVDTQMEEANIPFCCIATNFLMKKEVVINSGSMVDAVRASISLPGVFVPCKREEAYLVDGGVVNPVPVNVVRSMGADVVVAVNLNCDRTIHETAQSGENESPDNAQPSEATRNAEPDSQVAEEQSSQSQGESGLAERIAQRYQGLKVTLQDQIDDWMPDPTTGINIFDVIGNSINMMEQQVTRIRFETDMPDVLIEPDLMDYGIFDFQEARPMMQRGYDVAKSHISDIEAHITR